MMNVLQECVTISMFCSSACHQASFLFFLVDFALGCVALPSWGAFLFLVAAFPSLVAVVAACGLGSGWLELMK